MMLSRPTEWIEILEVNPPTLPDMRHRLLEGAWDHVLVTDNVFGKVRVSPYAFAARITHDVPSVHPTVVVSTRDRNILAIESEVRGALGNGVDSFLVVVGDTLPEVDHWANHYEIVGHLRELQTAMPTFDVGMPTRFRRWVFRRRVALGAQWFIAGPIVDPDTIGPSLERLARADGDPPVYLGIVPPFSLEWVARMESYGAVPSGDRMKRRLAGVPGEARRALAWTIAREVADAARDHGCAGVVLMGLRFGTAVDEARHAWRATGRGRIAGTVAEGDEVAGARR